MGYHRAGFDVVGVDIKPQPRYPFEFVQGDATRPSHWPIGVHAIHASPPCQAYSDITPDRSEHPDLVGPVRDLLQMTGLPYVIENVDGAPLMASVRLCGTMFPGLRVIRHRRFETNFPVMSPPCGRHPLLYVPDKRRPHQGEQDEMTAFVSVTGGGNCSKRAAADAMGIDWMTKGELNEAIPPAYTEHIGRFLLEHLQAVAA